MEHHVRLGYVGRPPRHAALRVAAAVVGVGLVLIVLGVLASSHPRSVSLHVASGSHAQAPTAGVPPSPAVAPVSSAAPTSRVIGHSVQGRPIEVAFFGSGPRKLLVVGGVHGDEYGTAVALEFADYLRTHPSAIAHGREIDVVVCANPDGQAARTRTNAHGVDLNRNFPSANWSRTGAGRGESAGAQPGSEPETRALVTLLASRAYAAVVSLHSRGGLIDFDGPGGSSLAERIAGVAGMRVLHLASLRTYSGSMGSFIPQSSGAPLVTWELSDSHLTPAVRAGLLAAAR